MTVAHDLVRYFSEGRAQLMTHDATQQQSTEQQRRAVDLSRQPAAPPIAIPGYAPRHFLGAGAFGEVWVAIDENTGRRVAIKFYTRGSDLDWSHLAREVEKLVFLSADRYVVQLLDVGWTAKPPYFVMEYVENGSLEQLLRDQGPLPVGEAVEMFREVATGLLRAHGKGVLHCDLKPGNILLDQDHQPRLADFGQSRLSHEQTPALGTLFFMAPEQADLQAVPDARWDVYALGALLYCMLTGQPPYRTEQAILGIDATPDLPARLRHYRHWIESSPPPDEVRRVPGIDRPLLDILDRCLAIDPDQRFANVQSVLDALEQRDRRRDRRPLVLLGLVGPILFLLVTLLFAWRSHHRAVRAADELLSHRAEMSNGFAADFVSEAVARRLESYFRAVEETAQDANLITEHQAVVEQPDLSELLESMRGDNAEAHIPLRDVLRDHPARQALQAHMERLLRNPSRPEVASWFVTDARGIHIAAAFDTPTEISTIGGDYSYRAYFHGSPQDKRPVDGEHIQQTHLTSAFQSRATGAWKVAISTPIVRGDQFLGVVALTVELGRLGEVFGQESSREHFNVLVDGRAGPNQGIILQHPLFTEVMRHHKNLDPRFSTDPKFRVPLAQLNHTARYRDPLENHPSGEAYRRNWIAAKRPVRLEQRTPSGVGDPSSDSKSAAGYDTGLSVLVQEDYDAAAGPVHQLGASLLQQGLIALSTVLVLIAALWYSVAKALSDPNEAIRRKGGPRASRSTAQSMETVELPAILAHRTPPTTTAEPRRDT